MHGLKDKWTTSVPLEDLFTGGLRPRKTAVRLLCTDYVLADLQIKDLSLKDLIWDFPLNIKIKYETKKNNKNQIPLKIPHKH